MNKATLNPLTSNSKSVCVLKEKELYLNGSREFYSGDYCTISDKDAYLNGSREFFYGNYCVMPRKRIK